MKIVADERIPFIKNYFEDAGDLVLKPGRAMSPADVKDADMLVVRSITPVNEALLKGSRVKYVGSVTAGHDHLDTAWLDQAGIAWEVAEGFNAPPVADYVMCVVAALQRKQLFQEKGMRVAVIGVGNVGQLVADRLKLLDFKVVTCDPLRAASDPQFKSTTLSEIADCDLITLHVPLTKAGTHPTYHMIDKTFLSRQMPESILLNTSRGSVINFDDLKKAGAHLYWCFDVWEHEPHIDKKILERAMIASPHIAGYSLQSKIRGVDMIYQKAIEKKWIQPAQLYKQEMPRQTLTFAGAKHHWQDMVLGVFNPLVMTAMMRNMLLPAESTGVLFDDLRHQFTYRHEFGFTSVSGATLANEDIRMLARLGMTLV